MADLRYTLKWLYAGLALTSFWVGIQTIALYTPLLEKSQVSAWQEIFSIRGLTKVRRVSGFAFEASWLAGQLVTLYIPWLVASLLTRFRITKNAWLGPLLLIGALASLLLTSSRGGLAISMIATGVILLVSGRKIISRVFQWFLSVKTHQETRSGERIAKSRRTATQSVAIQTHARGLIKAIALRIFIFLAIFTLLFGGIYFISQQKYINRLWNVEADSLSDYFVQINAGGRITYLWASAQVFAAHPVLGVGLGAAGFYLYPNFPDWALYNNPEIAQLLAPTSSVYPNAKKVTRCLEI
jgi:hypothetical protein